MTHRPGDELRRILVDDEITLIPQPIDVLSAVIFQRLGFKTTMVGSFTTSAGLLGWPDVNVLGLAELSRFVMSVVLASELPVIVDCDTGYGNAVNVIRTVREIERTGAAGLFIEDQLTPKRCGSFPGQRPVVSVEEMVGKIKAAVDSRIEDSFVIIARTDSLDLGPDVREAVERAVQYVEAGADAILPVTKHRTNLESFAQQFPLDVPLIGVPTPFLELTAQDLQSLGFSGDLQSLLGARAMYQALIDVMSSLLATGAPERYSGSIMSFEALVELVGVPQIAAWEDKYVPGGTAIKKDPL